MPHRRLTRPLTACLSAALITISSANLTGCSDNAAGRSGKVTSSGEASIGGAYTLINQDGAVVTDKDFLGAPQLIYFGFSYCPDICPTALQRMGAALDLMGKDAAKFQPIFITIDPERDTASDLKLYVTANGFPDNLIGLTGNQAQVDAAVAAYRVYAKRVDDPQSAGGYAMDHSSIVYLMDKDGKFVTLFTDNNTPDEISARLKKFLKTGA